MNKTTSAFGVQEVFTASWEMTKTSWMKYLILFLLIFAISFVPGIIYLIIDAKLAIPNLIDSILSFALNVYVGLVAIAGILRIAKHKDLDIPTLIKVDPKLFLQALGSTILMYLIIMVGFVLLIVPGIIASIMFSFNLFSIVDKQTNAIEALEDSMHLTKGNKMTIFLFGLGLGLMVAALLVVPMGIAGAMMAAQLPFWLVLIALFLVGVYALVVVFGASMVGLSAQAYMYQKMRAQTPLKVSHNT
ncbi:MAG: hypothetical protein WAZ14_03805 [Patescibacteria group bacterium]